jgi:uncharacterized membrane protein YgdD (TMEM256/DUF423 family)
MERVFFAIGAISAFIAVAAGAFGAHGLRGRVTPEMLSIFEVGVRYQIYHAVGLMAAAWAHTRWPSTRIVTGGWFFVLGTVLFCFSLYLLSLTGLRWLGAVTPLGGLAFLAGWLCLAWAAWRR